MTRSRSLRKLTHRNRLRIRVIAAAGLTLASAVYLLCCTSQATAQTTDAPAATQPAKPATEQATELTELHERLAKYLTATKWTGKFVMDGQDEARTEYYEIVSAEKGEIGDYWNLIARIKYGGNDVTMPLPPIEIKFAGETPVITIDRVNFPGFGMFDARVVIRKGKYAGTWMHSGGAGGHMFGVIEPMDAEEAKKKADEQKAQADQATKTKEDN